MRGPKLFKLWPVVFNYAQQIFPGGAKRFAGEASPPLPVVTGLCPIVLKYVQHIFTGGSKFFLASYGPGFAPYCCVDRLATVEALKMNAHLLLLLLATLQISGIECECLRKRHNWSLSIRFNSQLRVWVTGSRAMRGGLQVHCSGARQLRRGLKQKDRPVTSLRHQGVKSFLRGAQFF